MEPSSLAGLPGECHQTALLVTKSHLPVSATKAVSRVLSCGQEGSGTQPDKPPGVFCRTHKTLTWVFHLVMVQEAQGLQGIALRVPLQQPRGAALTWRKARDSHKLRLSQQRELSLLPPPPRGRGRGRGRTWHRDSLLPENTFTEVGRFTPSSSQIWGRKIIKEFRNQGLPMRAFARAGPAVCGVL